MPYLFEHILNPLLGMSVTAAFVAVVVILLRAILKKRAPKQVVCLLWLLVFARLLIPVMVQSPISLVPTALDDIVQTEQTEEPAQTPEPPAPGVADDTPVSSPTIPGTYIPNVSTTPAPPVVSQPVTGTSQSPAASDPVVENPPVAEVPSEPETPAETPVLEKSTIPLWMYLLPVVWLAGVAVMLAVGIGSYVKLRRRVYDAIRSEDGVWEHPTLASPFILGLIRPKIYLPMGIEGQPRQFILHHEHAHLRRLDHVVKPICWLALAIHWFNPLAWAAFLLMSRDIETACDESVIRKLGSEVKADYSATLLALATDKRFPAPSPLSFGEGDAKVRIKNVLNFKKPALWVTIAAVVVVIVAAVCLLTDPVDQFDPNDYITYDCYPGLYFEEITEERTGVTTTKAYKLVEDQPVLVAGWADHPANNFTTLIHPDGREETIFAATWEVVAQYEQYLVDEMMARDEGWAENYLSGPDRIYQFFASEGPEFKTIYGGAALTPEGNLLLQYWNESPQVLPLQTSIPQNASSTEVNYHMAELDGFDGLSILWKDGRKVFSLDDSGTLVFAGDALIVYEWDGETWIAHDSVDVITDADVPVGFDVDTQQIYVFKYDNSRDTLTFPIPEELGKVVTLSLSGQAKIACREDGGYDLTYGVFAMPEDGTSDADWVNVLDVSAIMRWNSLTEEYEITFTGAEAVGTPAYTTIPDNAETLADIDIASLHMLENGSVLLRYGDDIIELKDFGYNPMRPDCRMWATDLNGDGVKQIHIIHQFGSGTGVSIDRLTTVTPTEQGLEVSYHDWSSFDTLFEQSNHFTYYPEDNSISVTYEGQNLRVRLSDFYAGLDWDSYGDSLIIATVANYTLNEDGTVTLSFTPALSDSSPMVHYLPMRINYTLVFKKVFTGQLQWNGTDFTFTADEPGLVVQPYTVTPLEDSLKDGCYTRFELTHNGNTVQFSGYHLAEQVREPGDDLLTYYFDMTGDGVPDPVVMLVALYGSGPVKRDVHVFDGVTLEEYDIPNLFTAAEEAFIFSGDEASFFITGEGLSVTVPRAEVVAFYSDFLQSHDLELELLDAMELMGEYYSVTEKDGMLCVTLSCLISYHELMGRLTYGSVNAYMTLVDGKLTPVKLTFTDSNGVESGQSLTTLASLPEEEVWLYTDGEGFFWLDAYGHFGPVTILNDLKANVNPSTVAELRKSTVTNLSGPDFETIFFTMKDKGGTTPVSYSLLWNEDQGVWDPNPYQTTLSFLPRDIVTSETYPTDPEWYYKVAETAQYALYARNHGMEVLLTYGNFSWNFDHTAHTGRMNLPVMRELDDETVAVISEVNSGTGVSVKELVVYDTTLPVATDYLYDWQPITDDFNQNNTLIYDKETNSLTLLWNGTAYCTGTLAEDLAHSQALEDGWTGKLLANGDIINFTHNGGNSFTVTVETAIAGRPLSIGGTGFDLTWNVEFTGEGFEASAPAITVTGKERTVLTAAFPDEGIYLFSVPGNGGEYYYLFEGGQLHKVPGLGSLTNYDLECQLVDLDHDGQLELAAVGNFYAGSSGFSALNVFDKTTDGWKHHRLTSYYSSEAIDYVSQYDGITMFDEAVFTPGSDPTQVTMSLGGFDLSLTVTDEMAARDGDYYVSGTSRSIIWDGNDYFLQLYGSIHRRGGQYHWPSDDCGVTFRFVCRLTYNADGTFTQTPVGLVQTYDIPNQTLAAATKDFYAIRNDGSLIMWGSPEGTLTGSGLSNVPVSSPVELMKAYYSAGFPVFVDAGIYGGVMVVDTMGALYAHGIWAGPDAPTEPVWLLGGVSMVSCGQFDTFVLREDGTLWSYGHNSTGLSTLNTMTVNGITWYKLMDGVISVEAGGYGEGRVILSDHTLWAWNRTGEMVKLADNVASCANGRIITLDGDLLDGKGGVLLTDVKWANTHYAIKTDGTLWALTVPDPDTLWGAGTPLEQPVLITDNVSEMVSGEFESILLKTDGTLWKLAIDGSLTDSSIALR